MSDAGPDDLARCVRVGDGRWVQRWDPLTDPQLALLRRIAAGDDLSGPDGVRHRVSARGLQSRRLVEVSRKGGVWRATVTDAGTFYLQHGQHPDHPDRLRAAIPLEPQTTRAGPNGEGRRSAPSTSDPSAETANVSASTSFVEQAKALIDRLRRDDGTVRIEGPDEATRARYRRIIHAAKQHQLVPTGFHLLHTGRDRGDIVIRLSPAESFDATDWNRIRLNARRVTTDPSVVFTALENDPAGLAVSEEAVPRALALIRGLAAEAGLRGHRLGVNTKTKHPKVYLQLGQTRRSVTVTEECDKVKHRPTPQELRDQRRKPWIHVREYDDVPSGRLRLQVARAGWNRYDTWADEGRNRLERRLRQIIRDVEAGIAEDEAARLAAQRAAEEAAAERRRHEEETRNRWQAAMAKARVQAVEKLRKDAFGKAFDAWLAAREIRDFCAALEQAGGEDHGGGLVHWIAWGNALADRIDPTKGPAALHAISFDVELQPEDLRAFLGDWSPHRPQREYRTDADEKRLADIRSYAEAWHPGMRGRRNWWRR
jgi:hypothetical protein